jgi:hypothetical protein
MKICTLLLAALLFVSCKKETENKIEAVKDTIVKKTEAVLPVNDSLCFLKVISRDSIVIKARKYGDSISGIFKWNPYEKDKKTNTFRGHLVGNTVTAIGTTSAEGMIYKEELIFTLTDSTAAVKMGEMIEGDDGIWMYKNKNMASEQVLAKVSCN